MDKVRLALVGLRFGANVARDLLRRCDPHVEVVALCDRDRVRAEKIQAELSLPLATLEDILADPSIEAVGLFTEPVGRAALIRRVIRAGKDVITTKPLELDAAVAREILEEARTLGRVLHLNSPGPEPAQDLRQIATWRDQFDLGPPVALRAETWTSTVEQANGSWYDDTGICDPAPLVRLGIYFMSEFSSSMGEPESVQVFHSRLFTGRPTADNAQANIRYRTGALGSIYASFCIDDGRPYADHVTLSFQRGTIRRWVHRVPGVASSEFTARLELAASTGQTHHAETAPGNRSGAYQWDAFHKAVRGRLVLPPGTEAQVISGIRLLDAMRRSSRSGQVEAV